MEKKRVFILPGEIAISRKPAIIATLLGSCVAVCLYNERSGIGGMNHFMLPEGGNEKLAGKYGDISTNKLIDTMLKLDPKLFNIQAKIFGGASVVGHLSSGMDIGKRNITMALKVLNERKIKIVQRKTGGNVGMKIFFDNTTGEVEKKDIQKSDLTARLEEKKKDLAGRKIRTLIVDDSPTVRGILRKALSLDPEIEVIDEAEDAYEARSKILELNPDVVTLDIIMPKLDGVSFLKKLMIYNPLPVIIVSSVAQKGSKMRLRAHDIGAVDILDKEDLKLYQGLDTVRRVLAAKIKMAATSVVKKRKVEDIGHI